MGIAGAGNSGTALATLFAPLLAAGWSIHLRGFHVEASGWYSVFALALIPVLLTLLVFTLVARDSPNQPAPKRLADYTAVLGQRDTWWFCLFYAITFGGFVGFAVFLNSFFHVQYELDKVQAGLFATLCVIAGSFLRPVGGYLADRFGGIRMLMVLYVAAGVLLLGMAALPPLLWGTLLMFGAMALLGMGNGAVFQLVPQRFPREIGVITGIVGAAGGLGGFFLPTLLGGLKEGTGSFAGGFLIFALAGCFGCAVALFAVSRRWQGAFVGKGGLAATPGAPAETNSLPRAEAAVS
jgi:NNP family nitrate/nitrite transporter-like MFS transporter